MSARRRRRTAWAPKGGTALTASGGSGTGFTWAYVTNASQGSLTATGAYKAGATGDVVDVVRAKDSLGNVANVRITVTTALQIAPTQVSTPPNGELAFTATGGAEPYRFSVQTNASGSNVVDSTGHYRAGATANVQDVVAVTDANGVVATAVVQVGTGVSVTPSVAIVAPNGSLAFEPSGGSGQGYVWAMITNASTGSIDPDTGIYLAGPTANVVDVIRVTDSILNSADVSIVVGDALVVTPLAPHVAPRESVPFTATGGTGEFQFSVFTNASGATIDPVSGVYVAGTTPAVVDRVQVADRVGNVAFVDVTVGPGLLVTPATLALQSGATATFSVSGGSGAGYTWSVSKNVSGGSIDATTGAYVAGAAGGVDVVQVVDSLANQASAQVDVTPLPAPKPTGDAGAASDADGGTGEGVPPIGDSGCTCHAFGGPSSGAGGGLLFALAALVLRRRRVR